MNRSRVFRVAAAIILGITAFFWLGKAVTDLTGGVPGGILNLILAIVLFALTILSWRRMLLGGIITASLAVVLAVFFNLYLPNINVAYIPMLLMCAPMVISGLLFIEAEWAGKVRN